MKVLVRTLFVIGLVIIVAAILVAKVKPESMKLLPETTKQLVANLASEPVSPLNIEYLRSLTYDSPEPAIESFYSNGSNYKSYIASYTSEGNKIYGLLTVPNAAMPEDGFPAIVFVHGYIPPSQYVTTEKYIAYVDTLARNGFVVFKIDLRGHGKSEGVSRGTYFSPDYTIDAINALKSLQIHAKVNPTKIGMWGHSMAGNLVLRAMLVSSEIKAGVIWAGAVYSYEDYAKYRLNDASFMRSPQVSSSAPRDYGDAQTNTMVQKLRERSNELDFTDAFWTGISLTKNLRYLKSPLQLHHAKNDSVVNVGYSRDLKQAIEDARGSLDLPEVEVFEYDGGEHNITSPYFEVAIQRTVDFYKKNL